MKLKLWRIFYKYNMRVIPKDNVKQKKNISKIKYSVFDINKDGNVNFNDIISGLKKWFNCLFFIYDVSLDNFPFASSIGLFITVTATVIISTALNSCNEFLLKYDCTMSNYLSYHIYGLLTFILIHIAVFCHGLSVCILESSRECCLADKVGCSKSSCCKCIESCAQISCQVIWGVIGTLMLWILYFISILLIILSSLSTLTSYIFKESCYIFTEKINLLVNESTVYLNKAKLYLHKSDNITRSFLLQYNKFKSIQELYLNSGMNEISNYQNTIYDKKQEEESMMWERNEFNERNNYNMRKLYSNTFDPSTELEKGRSFISVFNETIIKTESKINYYTNEAKYIEEFCYDYSNLYDNLYLISLGIVLILISQYIMYAAHYKYFTAWNYEIKLIKNNN
tara:strand:- start:618 stop:1808 length:1191 start_codon:yes stop_codon:yes gene_type:complete